MFFIAFALTLAACGYFQVLHPLPGASKLNVTRDGEILNVVASKGVLPFWLTKSSLKSTFVTSRK